MNKKGLQLLTIIGAFTTIFVTTVELSSIGVLEQNKGIIYFSFVAILISFSIIWFAYELLAAKKNQHLKISILGRVAVGKTVYATVLFNELLMLNNKRYEFSIPDKKTTEIVLKGMRLLSNGKWLWSTAIGGGFSYKGLLMKSLLTKRTYSVDVTDFSGEEFQGLGEDRWFHNESFFQYIRESNIILFAVDASEYGFKHFNLYDFIATVNLLHVESYNKKINQPIALLFLKSDLIGGIENVESKEKVLSFYQKLIEFCELKCKYFKYFFVTSIGEDANKFDVNQFSHGGNYNQKNNEKQAIKIEPNNVKEAFLWAIDKLKK